MPTDLIIIGGGEHARVVIDAALLQPDEWNVIGFIDSQPCSCTVERYQIPRLGDDDEFEEILKKNIDAKVVIGIGGQPFKRQIIIEKIDLPSSVWATIIHPSAVISNKAEISYGVVILSRVVIQTGAIICEHSIINNGSIIEHDVYIGKNTHVSPGGVIGGKCNIGKNCIIGLGARIRDHITLENNVIVGSGAVVITDVPVNETVLGVPAKRLSVFDASCNVNIEDICVREETTLYETMSVLGKYGTMIIFVINYHKQLLGILSYGDIRDALLDYHDLNQPVKKFMNEEYHHVTKDVSRIAALEYMKAIGVNRLPVLDDENRVVGLHLVEGFIGGISLKNPVVIMAGGRGERLKPITNTIPKPMAKVAGRPILEHIICHLASAGAQNIYISINYLGNIIEDYFGDGSKYACNIKYIKEKKPLGTGGALSLLPEKSEGPIIVLNGDLITGFNVERMLFSHQTNNNSLTIGVHQYNIRIPYGVVSVDDVNVVGISEKPEKKYLVNGGVYVVDSELLERIPEDQEFFMTDLIEDSIQEKKKVGAYLLEGDWIDVGRHKELAIANGLLTNDC